MTSGTVHITMDQLRGTAEKKRDKRPVPWGPAAAGVALVMLLEASYFKASSLLDWMSIDLTLLGALLVAAGGGVAWVRAGMKLPRGLGTVLLLFLLLFVPGAMVAGAGRGYSDAKVLGLYLTAACAIAPLFLIRSHSHRTAFVVAVAAAGMAFAVLVKIDPAIAAQAAGRLALDGGNTIAAGRAAGAGMLALAYLTLRGSVPLPWRGLGLLGVGLLGMVMFQSGSRGPLVAVVAALVLAVLFAPGRRGSRLVRVVTTVMVLAVFAFVALRLTPDSAADRIAALGGGLSADASAQARLQLYSSAFDTALGAPEGIGWGNLWTHIPAWALLDSGYRQYPHNLLIEVTTEAGWLAGVALVIVLVMALARARRHMTSATGRAVFALLVFFLLNAMVSGDINDNRFLFALVALALALPRRGEQEGDEDRPAGGSSVTEDPCEPRPRTHPDTRRPIDPSPARIDHRSGRTASRR